jgi:hypothetical protein
MRDAGLEAGRGRDDAAEGFVEAARIFGDFFYGVAQLGWNGCGGGWPVGG